MLALIVILLLVFITGLCIGSFLNVVILRALSEESIVFPASKCPKCQTPLKWWHNIPVLSYIFLRGKCAFCKEKISIQYPIIELVTGIVFTLVFLKFGLSIETLLIWAISSMMIVLAGTDIKEKVVFDVHTFTFIGLAIVNTLYLTGVASFLSHKFVYSLLITAAIGAVVGAVILELCARAGYLVAGTRAFGEGDTFIAFGLGALLGWKLLLVTLALSVVIQVILFLPLFIKQLIQSKEWKTLTSFTIFVLYAIVFCIMQQYKIALLTNAIIYPIGAILLCVLGIATCAFIFKGLREHPENRTYMPFGPALVLAGLIVVLLF